MLANIDVVSFLCHLDIQDLPNDGGHCFLFALSLCLYKLIYNCI